MPNDDATWLERYCAWQRIGTLGCAVGGRVSNAVKRFLEQPRRSWRIWAFDTSKQALGQAAFHGLNIALALALGVWNGQKNSDACVWYFLNTVLDCTLGLALLAGLVALADRIIRRRHWYSLYSGEYGRPPKWSAWARQAGLFVGIVGIVKVCTTLLLLVPFLEPMAEWLLSPISGDPTLELVFVMVLTPLVLDVIAFWVTDQIIKDRTSVPEPQRRWSTIAGETEEEAESLMLNDVYGIDDTL